MNLAAIITSILVVALLLEQGIKEESAKSKYDSFIIFVVSSILVFAAALRAWTVGSDTYTFVDDYTSITSYKFLDVVEQYYDYLGYYILSWLFTRLNAPVFVWFGFIEFVYLFSINKFIGKLSRKRLFSFFCFFTIGLFFPSFNILKQILALSFVLLSYCALVEKKWLKTVILFIIAFISHPSSIIFLVVFAFYYLRKYSKMTPAIITALIVVGFVGKTVWPLLTGGGLGNEHFGELYSESDDAYNSTMLYYLLLLLFISVVIKRDFGRLYPPESRFYLYCLIFTCVLQSFASSFSIAHRLAYFSMPFYIIMIPNELYYFKNRQLSTLIQWMIILGMAFFCIYSQRNTPFDFIFNVNSAF